MFKKIKLGQVVLNLIIIIICCLIIVPLILMISVSFSSEASIAEHGYKLIPKEWDVEAYRYILKNPKMLIDAYTVTILSSTIGTVLTVLFTAMLAYPLSRKGLKGRKIISFYLYFTMLFSGGLVPTYILKTQYLHLGNNFLIYILPSLVSVWHVFMMRTFFSQIPNEIFESMKLDGASEFSIFFKTVIPLSKPIIATVALLTFLGKWGDWYTAMLYIDDDRLITLQYLLQKMLRNLELVNQMSESGMGDVAVDVPGETVRMAMAVVAAGPALVIFPFFQKYFVKGLTVGSVKG